MEHIFQHALFLFALLNPFLLSVYLMDLIHTLDQKTFVHVLTRGSINAAVVYIAFAVFGDRIFTDVFQVRFSSFLVFGGIVFLIAGVRFVFGGASAMYDWRGEPEHIAGSIAMPFLIGPATVSACVIMGEQLNIVSSIGIIVAVMAIMVISLILFKFLYDYLSKRNEKLIRRYVEIMGRISALYVGMIAVEMIFKGLESWITPLLQ